MSTVEAADMSALASARTGTAGGTMRPDMRGRARIIYHGGPGRGPPSSIVQRQRDEQRDDERDVGERDRRALPRRQRVVTRYGVAPAPHEREEPDDQHDQQERRAGEQERADERDEYRRAGGNALAPQRHRVAHLVDEDQQHEAGGEGPAPLDRVGADRQQHRRERLEFEDARQQAEELGLAEDEEEAAAHGAGGDAAAHARAGLGRPGAGLQALVDGAEVVDLARAALGVVRHAARSSLGGRGITHASYSTMARNTSFMSPKFTARTR